MIRHLIPLVGLMPFIANAQDGARIEILGADDLKFDEALAPGAQRLIGNARFKHEGAIMRCDSAYYFANSQVVNAFGNVVITQGDTLRIAADRLDYAGRDRIATLTGKVALSDKDMDLTTDALTYDLRSRTASYTSGGRIVSRKENNTLTSTKGAYLAAAHKFVFNDDVVLQHPERTITSDTLHYTTTSGMATFFGPTTIIAGTTRMWCTHGTYDTRTEKARFTRRARVLEEGRELMGDSLHYDRLSGMGWAWGHVVAIDTAGNTRAQGDLGRYEQGDRSMITGHAELIMLLGDDSLHLHGDTIFTAPDTAGHRQITARRGVRFFKSDLQGVCDTMTYSDADSLIHLVSGPVIWSRDDQITGRRIRIQLKDGKAHRLFVDEEAFLVSQVDSVHFDQVTGTTMTGFFKENELHHLIAAGTCRTVYFAREESEDGTKLMGMNRVDCSRISVQVSAGEVNQISFLDKPDGTYYPIDRLPTEGSILRGFEWRVADRPRDRADIFR